MTHRDNSDYAARRRFFDSLLTIYGRKPVLEVLQDPSIPVYRLHLATSNKSGGIVGEIERAAAGRGIDVLYHEREALSRISRNRKQDQGVAADLQCPNYHHYRDFLDGRDRKQGFRLMALDRVTNPQNLGMVIRSVAASPLDGLLLPARGCAPLSPLVIKASTGTLFRCPILRCDSLDDALADFADAATEICVLSGAARETLGDHQAAPRCLYVLGNETEGVSPSVIERAHRKLKIPMHNGVESLNVAVTAGLIAFRESV